MCGDPKTCVGVLSRFYSELDESTQTPALHDPHGVSSRSPELATLEPTLGVRLDRINPDGVATGGPSRRVAGRAELRWGSMPPLQSLGFLPSVATLGYET